MKPKSYRLAMAIALCMSITSFSAPSATFARASSSTDNNLYYFFSADDDSYQTHCTTSTEVVRLQTIYGVVVNGSPFGGTLVERGYSSPITPHQVWPSVFLYAHF